MHIDDSLYALRFLAWLQEIAKMHGFILLKCSVAVRFPIVLLAQWNYEFPALIGVRWVAVLSVVLERKKKVSALTHSQIDMSLP